jgi:hypothetical protein
MMHGREKSDLVIVCAGQRPDQEGWPAPRRAMPPRYQGTL